MKVNARDPELLRRMDAYWRAANYLSVGHITDDNLRCCASRWRLHT
jgi:phosphoketolase